MGLTNKTDASKAFEEVKRRTAEAEVAEAAASMEAVSRNEKVIGEHVRGN